MQKINWEDDVKRLCKLLFDFVNSDYDLVSNKDDSVKELVEWYRRVISKQDENYGDSDSTLLNKLDEYAKKTKSEFSIRVPSSLDSSHGWKIGQEKSPSRQSISNIRDAIRELLKEIPNE